MQSSSKVVKCISIFSLFVFIVYLLLFVFNLISEAHGTNSISSPYGVDFGVYYTAGKMVLSGDASQIYSVSTHHVLLESILNRDLPFYLPWLYPPMFLLIIVPFSFLPFPLALSLWLAVTFAFAFIAVRRLIIRKKELVLLLVGIPGFMLNLRWGQNAFLSTGLIAFGLYYLESNPVLAGLMFGLLAYKPQMAAFPFLLLLLTKKWRVLKWSAIFGAASVLLSGLLFGFDLWGSFLQSLLSSTTGLMESNWLNLATIQPSLYTTLHLLGLSNPVNYGVLAIVGILAVFFARWVWLHTDRIALKASAMILGIFLVNPYFLLYDLMILCIPLVLLADDCIEYGCNAIEFFLLIMLWVVPFLDWNIAMDTNFHVLPILLLGLFGMTVLRVKKEKKTVQTLSPNSTVNTVPKKIHSSVAAMIDEHSRKHYTD